MMPIWLQKLLGDKYKVFIRLVVKAAKLFFGSLAQDLYDMAERHVKAAEKTGKPGIEKYKMAYDGIVTELHGTNIPKYLINLMIEAAVLVLKERLYNSEG